MLAFIEIIHEMVIIATNETVLWAGHEARIQSDDNMQ